MQQGLLPTIVFILSFAAYLPALSGGYIHWDDGRHIYNNPLVYADLAENLLRIFGQTINGTYIPLTTLSFNIEYHIFGLHPATSHFINIALHGLVSILIFNLLQRFNLSLLAAFLASVFFALHPMHVESVAWATERKDVLYSLFYLLSVLAYIDYINKPSRALLMKVTVFGVLSILSKPMAVSLPWVLLLIDWWFKRPFSIKLLVEKIPIAFLIGSIAAITFLKLSPKPALIFPDAILIAIWSLMFYIIKFIFPYPLLPLYIPPEPVSLATPIYTISLITAFILIASFFLFAKHRHWRFALLWWLLSIFFFMRVNFADINIVADRFMYLPSIGFCAVIGILLAKLINHRTVKLIGIAITSTLIIFLGLMTFYQSRLWQDDHNLWRHVLKHEPKNSIARKKINFLLYNEDQERLDINLLDEAINKNPRSATAFINRGLKLIKAGQQEMAMQDFNRAITLEPQNPNGYINRGSLYNWFGKNKPALNDFNKAISLDNNDSLAYINRGIVYTQQQRFDLALTDFNQAIALSSNDRDAYYRRGIVFMQQNAWPNAINDFSEVLRINPTDQDSLYQRAIAYKRLKQFDRAKQDLQQAFTINPSNSDISNDLGVLLLMQGSFNDAIETFNKAITLDPYNAQLYANRANVWLKKRQFDLALTDMSEAISLSHKPWRYLITRGDIYMTRAQFNLAAKDFMLAFRWAPTEPMAIFKLARAQYEQGLYKEALNSLNKAIQLDPHDSNFTEARALVYEKLGITQPK